MRASDTEFPGAGRVVRDVLGGALTAKVDSLSAVALYFAKCSSFVCFWGCPGPSRVVRVWSGSSSGAGLVGFLSLTFGILKKQRHLVRYRLIKIKL